MGSILSIIAGAIGLFNKLTDLFKSKQDRDLGAQAQQNADLRAEIKADEKMLEAANSSTPGSVRDSLRDGDF